MLFYPGALLLACLMAGHGLRKGSLSMSGALAAFSVGYATMANPVKAFGVTLIIFYLAGSRATRLGHAIKATLETEQHRPSTSTTKDHKASSGGQRDAWQVACNSLVSALSALAFRTLYQEAWDEGKAWCLLEAAPRTVPSLTFLPQAVRSSVAPFLTSNTPLVLFLLMLGHFSCCMGDTLASELGILAKKPPRLILPPFAVVPPGTNGGLSWQGSLGSLLGGAFVGLVAGCTVIFFDNPACTARSASLLAQLVVLGAFGGVCGSGIDSLLGATMQRTWYNESTKKVLLGRLAPFHASKAAAKDDEWRIVTGHDILTNNTVNFLSSSFTAIFVASLGAQIL